MAKLGFIGLGIMGDPMARKLLAAGHDVALWSKTPGKAESAAKVGTITVALTFGKYDSTTGCSATTWFGGILSNSCRGGHALELLKVETDISSQAGVLLAILARYPGLDLLVFQNEPIGGRIVSESFHFAGL